VEGLGAWKIPCLLKFFMIFCAITVPAYVLIITNRQCAATCAVSFYHPGAEEVQGVTRNLGQYLSQALHVKQFHITSNVQLYTNTPSSNE